jgi:large subunit ribosomal protein L28
MASVCEICGKGKQIGHKVSRSNIKTKRAWSPNIQNIRANVKGTVKRINVCTRCLKAGKVERAI